MFEAERKQGLITEENYNYVQLYVERLSSRNLPIIFNLRHLRKVLQIPKTEQRCYFGCLRNDMYRDFYIKKRSGGYRHINAPNTAMKTRQLWIKENILDHIATSEHATGFKAGTSIYDNAAPHVNKELVLNLDLKDFFPSVTYGQVFKVFKYIGYTNQVSHLLTKLCTSSENVLPQGAPTSPGLSNLVVLKLDKRLSALAKCAGANYTRYADDITFSGKKSIKSLCPLIYKIVEEEGFQVNEQKVRLQYSFQRQVVTGLIVNDKVSVPKTTVRELENAIYYSKKYGVLNHMRKIDCDKAFYKEHLYGIAYYIKMIDEDKGRRYLEQLDEVEWPY